MKTLPLLIAAAVVALPAGYLATRSSPAIAAPPAGDAAVRTIALGAASQGPVDADYMVPGVLDNRSWKPEYDRMPAVHAPPPPRRAALAARRPAEPPTPVADTIASSLQSDAPIAAEDQALPDVTRN